ncbi:MAG TPA: hypothetical protein VKV35_14065, partial [Streptosporangiaceae bacterium]|nr:hypothetical protein [Streptosporangiaceae bacterium]
MGGGRIGVGSREARRAAGPAPGAGPARRAGRAAGRRRGAAGAAYLLAGAALFAAYLRLSDTCQLNSDSANILLMGRALLHGNLLLHGWYM